MKFQVTRQAISASPDPDANSLEDIHECVLQMRYVEDHVLAGTLFRLEQEYDYHKKERDRSCCDGIFGNFSHYILVPYADAGMASKAAEFSSSRLIPAVLELEAKKGCQFHKGALFYDTALSFLAAGDEARFEYYLAMTDEEDYLTHAVEGKPRERGMHNRKLGDLTSQTIQASVDFAVRVANDSTETLSCPISTVIGHPVTAKALNQWRANLDAFHHAELFRALNEWRIFCGEESPTYSAVQDNPYVMLRLVKVLSHVAQWAESQLTLLQRRDQNPASLHAALAANPALATKLADAKTLHKKLMHDPDLSGLASIAGKDAHGTDRYPGNSPNGSDVDRDLRSLLAALKTQTDGDEKAWRLLRIFYIVRNSTAHQIEPAQDFFQDRTYLLNLLQVVFVATLLIQHRKNIAIT